MDDNSARSLIEKLEAIKLTSEFGLPGTQACHNGALDRAIAIVRQHSPKLYNKTPETLQSDASSFTMGDCLSSMNDKNLCLSESGESDRQSEIRLLTLEAQLEELASLAMDRCPDRVKWLHENLRPYLRTTEPECKPLYKWGAEGCPYDYDGLSTPEPVSVSLGQCINAAAEVDKEPFVGYRSIAIAILTIAGVPFHD